MIATNNPAALALDAADGRIDGTFNGMPIRSGYSTGYTGLGATTVLPTTTSVYGARNPAALALDAADGRIDGTYFGAPIVGGTATRTIGAPIYGSTIGAPVYGSTFGHTIGAPVYGGIGANPAALALDAADGRIDGTYHGMPIRSGYTTGVSGYTTALPATTVLPATTTVLPATTTVLPATTTMVGAPLMGAPLMGAPVMGAPFMGAPLVGSRSAAAALDAADGRMDGRYFGMPIAGARHGPFGLRRF